MKALTYKGFQATVEFEDGSLFVRILHIDDVLIAEVDRASEAESAFHALVDDYLEGCAASGKEPCRPFKGSLNIRIRPELHRQAAMKAASEGTSLNSWIGDAIDARLQKHVVDPKLVAALSKELVIKVIRSEQARINNWQTPAVRHEPTFVYREEAGIVRAEARQTVYRKLHA